MKQRMNATGRHALAIGVLATASACAPPPQQQEAEFRIPIEVEDVETGTVEDLVVATGTLRPIGLVTLDIETPGLLQIALNGDGQRLAEGMRVSAGDVVARVTGEDARLHARLESTRQALEVAAAQLKRRRELHEANLAFNEEEVQQAEERYETARYNFERSTLDAAKATLETPIDGTILRLARDTNGRPQADGQLVRAGFTVAEVAPLDVLVADIDLIGPELARVQVGLAARIRHYAFEESFDGELIRLSPMLDPNKHTFRAEVSVANGERLLRPGMFVEVVVVIEQRPDVVVVSRDAVANRAGKPVAFVLDGQKVNRRNIRLGLGDDDKVQVLDGVAVGDRIAVRGIETLTDGARIRIVGS